MPRLNRTLIEAAILGFETRKSQIDTQIGELRSMLNGSGPTVTAASEVPARKRRRMSAAARKRIAEATRARWARFRAEANKPAPAPKPKRKLTRAAKAKLIANLVKARRARALKAKAAKA